MCSSFGLSCKGFSGFIYLSECFLSHIRKVYGYNLFKYFLRFVLSLFPSGTPNLWMLVCLLFQGLLDCSLFFSFFAVYSFPWEWFPLLFIPPHLFIPLPQLFCCWFRLVHFSFQVYGSPWFACSLYILPLLLNISCTFSICVSILFSEILDHPYYHYSEFFFR